MQKRIKIYPKTKERKHPSELLMISKSKRTSSHWKNMLINKNKEGKKTSSEQPNCQKNLSLFSTSELNMNRQKIRVLKHIYLKIAIRWSSSETKLSAHTLYFF